jgi:hypothetical protein
MGGSAAFAGRSQTGLAQKSAQGFAAEGETLDLAKFFAEMMVVEAGIRGAGQAKNDWRMRLGRRRGLGRPWLAWGAGASPVRQSRLPCSRKRS